MKTKPFLKSMALVICCLTSFVLVSCDKDDDKPNLKISPNKVEGTLRRMLEYGLMSVTGNSFPHATARSIRSLCWLSSSRC